MTNPSDINKATLARNKAAFDAAGIDISGALPMDLTQPTKQDVRNEKELQRLCEAELTRRGYLRLTADNAERVDEILSLRPCAIFGMSGWFSHRPDTKRGNKGLPLKPDLEIYAYPNSKPALFIELKVANRWQPGQREMVRLGFWVECWSFDAFVGVVNNWENGQ